MKPIAFFCSEYGVEESLHLYAGGLGILSGDFIRQAGDDHIPLVAIGLFYSGGFEAAHVEHTTTDSHILAVHGFQRVRDEHDVPILISIDAEEKILYAQAWTRTYGTARLYLLDTNVAENNPEDRAIMTHLYDSNYKRAMLQELILGIGGVKLLRTLKIEPGMYHLNEGHTAFVALALAAEYLHDNPQETSFEAALQAVRHQIVSTKHTILPGAGLYFEKSSLYSLVRSYIERHRIDFEEFFMSGVTEPNYFSTTKFLLQSSIRSNGVSMVHTIFEKQKHAKSTLISITNGVYAPKWRSPFWPEDGIGVLNDAELWQTRGLLRREMLKYVESVSSVALNPDALTIVWARRFAAYKRPYILFNDLAMLESIVSDTHRPVQIIISGMAHWADNAGREVVEKIKQFVSDKPFKGKIVYLPIYNIEVARHLVAGADVWLNTPNRGVEACGTSGMKAGLNGALQCSTGDGWIEEVDWTNIGWVLPSEGLEAYIYKVINDDIKPLFFERNVDGVPERWIKRVRETIDIVSHRYTAHRMIKDYVTKLYYPES